MGLNTALTFEEDIALDSEGKLDFHVAGSFTPHDGFSLSLTSHTTHRAFTFKATHSDDIHHLCSSTNTEGRALKVFYNACKNLLTKPSKPHSEQNLGYFFYSPSSQPYSSAVPYDGLVKMGKKSADYKNLPSCVLYLKFNCYDSMNDEHFSFFLIMKQEEVEKSEAGASGLTENKDLYVFEARVKKMMDAMTNRINSLIEENMYWKDKAMEQGKNVQIVSRAPKSKKKETGKNEKVETSTSVVQNLSINASALPFVFGVLSRYEDTISSDTGSCSSQLGQWYNNGAENMAAVLCGTHAYANQYVNFNVPPSIRFLQGTSGTFMFKEQHVIYNSGSCYQYPRAMLGMFFIKNETNQQKTFCFQYNGSCGWSSGYEGASVFLGTPNNNNNNASSISNVTWQNLWSYNSGGENFNASVNVNVPANTTVSLLLYTSSFNYTQASNFAVVFNGWKCFNMRTELAKAGLKIDMERTVKASQPEGTQYFYQLWN